MSEKPWLLIDVDGVLNVWPNPARPDGDWAEHTVVNPANDVPYRLHLNPAHGQWLLGLTDVFDLAWATTWNWTASTKIAPLIGLTVGLPNVPIPDPRYAEVRYGLSFKTPAVRFWLDGHERPAAWIDDDITPLDGEALSANDLDGGQRPPVLALNIDPSVGLIWEHIETLREWAEGLS